MIGRFGRCVGRNETTNADCGLNFVKGVSMANIKVFKVGAKIEELKADATAALEATKKKIEERILRK